MGCISAALVIKKGVKVLCKWIVLPHEEIIGKVDENGYKYLGVLEGTKILQNEVKQNVMEECLR